MEKKITVIFLPKETQIYHLAFAGIMVQVSFFVVYLMGNLTTWRTAAAISACLPVITALYVTQVGEYRDGSVQRRYCTPPQISPP